MLVISEEIRNRSRRSAIFVPAFSRGRLGPTRVPLEQGVGGIDHDSVLFCEEITTLDYEFLADGPLGESVPAAVLARVVRAVRRAIGEIVAEPMPDKPAESPYGRVSHRGESQNQSTYSC